MIRSFSNPETESIFQRIPIRRPSVEIQRTALRKLLMIDAATSITDLRVPPGNRLEALKGNRAGQYSIRVNDQWRVCFVWKNGHAYSVGLVDYH